VSGPVFSVFSDNISAFGALLVGVAAVTSALLSARSQRKKAQGECDQRIEDIKDAFQAGTKYEIREARRRAAP
jgi:hypothetical protein